MERRIYLASPYSHEDIAVREDRFKEACRVSARLMKKGDLVFSPIAHSHPVASYALPGDYFFWEPWCLSFLEHWATHLYVLQLDGWRHSIGVTKEISEALRLGLPIEYITGVIK